MEFKKDKIYKKNPPNWSYQSMLEELKLFEKIYSIRPIKNNHGGMKFPHMFAIYYILKKIKPDFVVESGIFKGQSTWLIEKTLPEAKILSIDINLSQRQYISESKNVKYSNKDFINHDFSCITDNSLVFFDDHQNALERIFTAYSFGFRNIIFEDNYPVLQGDCYSLKKIYHGSGIVNKNINFKKILKSSLLLFEYYIKKIINKNYTKELFKNNFYLDDVLPNKNHFKMVDKIIKTYFEFPPVFKTQTTRWGDEWNDENYPTEKPLLDLSEKNNFEIAFNEAKSYTWICYVELKKHNIL
jgi:hypothetical protein